MDFVPGALVAGRYRLRKMVGSGGMGEVWAGDDVKSGVKVAVKHLLPAAAKHHEVVARFKREAFLLGKIESEYVSRVVDFFDDETFGLVLVMEFIEGPSLAHILEQRTLTVEEAVDLAVDLLRALSQLHGSKIVHRDLKPGNIIMRPLPHGRNRATVVDFGISRLLADKGDNEVTGITRANIALGTVEYMAPEQILNSRDVTAVTDLYAVGIILFRAIKGHHAFGDRRGEELARAKLIEDAPALETGRADDLAKGLAAVVARALKKKPAHRFGSATEMLAVVEGLQRMSQNALDLDDSTTDSGETAVKPSPLSRAAEDDGPGTLAMAAPHALQGQGRAGPRMIPQAPPPAAGAPARPPVRPPPSAPPVAARSSAASGPAGPRGSGLDWSAARDDSKRLAEARPPLPSISESQRLPDARASLPSISESQRLPDARASLPSIPEPPRSGAERDGSASPRASMSSLHDAAPMVAPPPRSELTMERQGFGSRGTIALAILTSFAVGAAIGLIAAPTSAPAGKTDCPACASVGANDTKCAPTSAPATAALPTAQATAAPSAVPSATDKPTASAAASAKPALTGKLSSLPATSPPPPPPKPPPTAVPTFDGLGEDDPPPPKTAPPPPPPPPPPKTAPPSPPPAPEL